MSTITYRQAADQRRRHALARWGLLTDLQRPGQALANITPNWYAAVMGTGIVAVAALLTAGNSTRSKQPSISVSPGSLSAGRVRFA